MIYLCPHCHTQNFFSPTRKKLKTKIPLRCWKCGRKIKSQKKKKTAKNYF